MFAHDYIDYKDSATRFEAVIYARVSDKKQAEKGNGLKSQEVRGREYAKFLQIPVAETFHDKGVSGKILERPDVQRMLAFLRKPKPGIRYVVIVDDISRLARDYRVHFDLRDAIEACGALLDSPSTTFKAVRDADSNYVEGIRALGAQHFREKNAETCRNRKWSRLTDGYWPYKAPLGYKFEMTKAHGNLLMRDEPIASILAEGLEGYAMGRFASQSELKQFLETHPEIRAVMPGGHVRYQRLDHLMSNPLYAGYLKCDKLDIPLKKGRHDALISFTSFKKIEERRKGLAVAPARKDIHLDFPLRSFVTCADCGKPYRSCWSKGKRKKYPYYTCQTKGCASAGKSVPRGDIEGGFATLLEKMRPAPKLMRIVKDMVFDAWDQRAAQATQMQKAMRRDIKALDKKIDELMDRVVDAGTPRVMQAFERKIDQLEHNKLILEESLAKGTKPQRSREDLLEHALRFLANPHKIWHSGDFTLQRMVLRLAFAAPLPYHRIEGYRTPKTTLPFSMLADNLGGKCNMVQQLGVI